jgi:hypothetical protein
MGLLWFLIWLALAVYSLTSLAILIVAGIRWVWGLIPEGADVVERRARMRHDGELVRLGKVPGYRGPV